MVDTYGPVPEYSKPDSKEQWLCLGGKDKLVYWQSKQHIFSTYSCEPVWNLALTLVLVKLE